MKLTKVLFHVRCGKIYVCLAFVWLFILWFYLFRPFYHRNFSNNFPNNQAKYHKLKKQHDSDVLKMHVPGSVNVFNVANAKTVDNRVKSFEHVQSKRIGRNLTHSSKERISNPNPKVKLQGYIQTFTSLKKIPIWFPQHKHNEIDHHVNFLVAGDLGGLPYPPYTTDVLNVVSKIASSVAQNYQSDFVLSVGDNFYFHGVKNVDDPRFKQTFEDVFPAQSLHIPWFVVAGNHDHHRNVSAQIAYSKVSERWIFPEIFYKITLKLENSWGLTTVSILMIDTIALCGNADLGDGIPPGPADIDAAEKYWNWLLYNMQSDQSTYFLIVGHYPIYSTGSHGSTDCLIQRLLVPMEKYKASAYLSGHDHLLQHNTVHNIHLNHTIHYIISGSGSFLDPGFKDFFNYRHNFNTNFSKIIPGFAQFLVAKDYLELRFYGQSEKNIYVSKINPRVL